MKTTFIYVITLCITVFMGCSKDSSDQISEPQLITDCFQFKDSETNMPLEGVFVRINYMRNSGVPNEFTSSSDDTGMVCWEHKIGETIIAWFASIEHYEDIGCHQSYTPLPNIVSMKNASYFKFIIKNIESQSANDVIKIDYRSLSCFGDDVITLMGSDIDTILIRETRSGNNFVTWRSTGANSNIESFQILTQSRDTTSVEIEY